MMQLRYRVLLTIVVLILLIGRLVSGAEYHRDQFSHWSDFDHDGLDTREEALVEQEALADKFAEVGVVSLLLSEDGTEVLGGVWVCPYTGKLFTEPGTLDADHIVPLKWAWEHGADKWTAMKRELFANDPLNILVVAASANRSKGAKGPEDWLPANLAFADYYILKFIQVCNKYNLEYPKEKYHKILVEVVAHKLGLKLYKLHYK